MTKIKIKDIYAGKPDAKDEINFDGPDEFMKAFVVPRNFNVNMILSGNKFFITGYKGAGKTALLFYLDNIISEKDSSACSSFIFFKEDYTDLRKSELDSFSRRLLSSISIDKNTLTNLSDFEYIWRWLFFKRIVSDNEFFNNGLFINDDNWQNFVNLLNSIKDPENPKKSIIPSCLKLVLPIAHASTGIMVTPEITVDLQNNSSNSNIDKFITIIDAAEESFAKVQRTDIPYHIFVDELEAYYGDITVFHRDLNLIRDLLFTIKRLNSLFSSSKMLNTKIICSVRTEIVNSISRNVLPKELNKIVSGFKIPLKWNYDNTNSFSHPILQILLRRIIISEMKYNKIVKEDRTITEEWFPDNIHDIVPASYILNNSWCKPRDIVRLILSAQNSLQNESTAFTTAVFLALKKQYSTDSLEEIKEELRALYTTKEIDTIINCFNGFKSIFNIKDLKARIQSHFKNTILDTNFSQILNDLYRLSFIGNCIPSLNMYRWNYKGDDNIILSDEWKIMIHQGLQAALSVGRRQDHYITSREPLIEGYITSFTIKNINKNFLNGYFTHYRKQYDAFIHISQINGEYISDLKKLFKINQEVPAVLLKYDKKYSKWSLAVLNTDI